jgi:uncharacterized membrane protein HdeD (DUF308 family)
MTEEPRSIRRLVLGIFSITLGAISLFAFSVTYIAGIGVIGVFYGLIFIIVGVSLIRPKKDQEKNGIQ